MKLDDEQIERYSRQLILKEVGPRGQKRLGAARVAIIGTGVAADRVIAYLAAAGVGEIVADAALRSAVDPDQPDCIFTPLTPATFETVDAAVVNAATVEAAADALADCPAQTPTVIWIADGTAGGTPPCPRCAAGSRPASAAPPALVALRDACVGTMVATEVVKALLAIGTGLAGRALTYDPTTATIETVVAASRPGCCGG